MLKVTLILLCLGLSTAFSMSFNHLQRNTELNLLQLMMDTRIQQRANPERSLDCFDYYSQLFDSIGKEYKRSYAQCLANAKENRAAIDAATQPERELIEQLASLSCAALEECAALSGSIEYFECFANIGKENTENMYEISANASENLAEVRESYRIIENNEYRCTNASERVYVEQSYQANLDLQSCLRGETAVPTTSPPSDTTTDGPDSTPVSEDPATPTPDGTTTDQPDSTPASEDPATPTPDGTTTDQPDSTPASEDPATPTADGTTTDQPDSTPASEDPATPTPDGTTTNQPDSTPASGDPATPTADGTTTDDPKSTTDSSESDLNPTDSPEGLMPEEDIFKFNGNSVSKLRVALSNH